jgi:hypothetical protein
MKQNKLVSSLLIAGCLLGVGSTAFGAACSNIQAPVIDSSNQAGPFAGNSCGNNAAFNGASTFCGGVQYSNTGTDVWQVTLGAAQNFTFTVTTAAFTPDIALFSGACTDSAACVNNTDYSTASPTTTATYTGNPAGTYFIVITDSTASGAQCGAYNLSIAGTLPVKLQNFSIN